MKRGAYIRHLNFRRVAAVLASLTVAAGCTSEIRTPASHRGRKTPLFATPYVIEVTGSNNLWQVRYPDPSDGSRTGKHVRDVRNIHVPLGAPVVLALRSRDYVYTLAIPDYGIKEIAVPECEFRMEFQPRAAGRLELVGEHLCGDPFAEIAGQLVIETQEQFRAWLQR